MTGLPIIVAPPTAEGRLVPDYLNSLGILVLRADPLRSCPFGVTIDGCLILDFDADGLLAGVELILPMRAWKGKADTAPPDAADGNILLAAREEASAPHAGPVTVSKDMQTGAARIDFGDGHDRAVRLSERCSALLLGDRLTGFWFRLAG
jgi:hypothetical protein